MESTTAPVTEVTGLRLQVKALEFVIDELIGSLQECTAPERWIEKGLRHLSVMLEAETASPSGRGGGNARAGLEELVRQLEAVRSKLRLRRQQLAVSEAHHQARQSIAARASQDARCRAQRRQEDDLEAERTDPSHCR